VLSVLGSSSLCVGYSFRRVRDEGYAKTTPRRLDPFPVPIIARSVHSSVGQHKFICFPTSFRKLSSLGAPPHLGRCMHGSGGTHSKRKFARPGENSALEGRKELLAIS
jgi:hypothetical protein